MSHKSSQKRGQVTRGERVGRFHFAASGPREFRLVAILFSGARITLQTGATIGHLWRHPWLVSPEFESEVIDLRVEHRAVSTVKSDWKPVLREFSSEREYDE